MTDLIRYAAKAVVALVGAVLIIVAGLVAEGTAELVAQVVLAVVVGAATYRVPNKELIS